MFFQMKRHNYYMRKWLYVLIEEKGQLSYKWLYVLPKEKGLIIYKKRAICFTREKKTIIYEKNGRIFYQRKRDNYYIQKGLYVLLHNIAYCHVISEWRSHSWHYFLIQNSSKCKPTKIHQINFKCMVCNKNNTHFQSIYGEEVVFGRDI